MKLALIILISLLSLPSQGQSDSTLKQSFFLNYGVEIINYKFTHYVQFVHLGYEKQINKKWSLTGAFKTDKFSTSDFTYDFRLKLSDTVTIYQNSLWQYSNVYQLYLGANRRIGKYFSIGANLLMGYNRKKQKIRFTASSYNIPKCESCLESYLGELYDASLPNQEFVIGYSNKLSLGASLLFTFEYPITKQLSVQLKYGREFYYNFDLGNTIDFDLPIDFYPNSYFRGNHYLTTGIRFRF